MKKIRLYRGPFNGKVLEHPRAGANVIMIEGLKPMSRKQKHEWMVENYHKFTYGGPSSSEAYPRTRAVYRICMGPSNNYQPLYHPDGSIFYQWDKEVNEKEARRYA